jgi:hypothetical protein
MANMPRPGQGKGPLKRNAQMLKTVRRPNSPDQDAVYGADIDISNIQYTGFANFSAITANADEFMFLFCKKSLTSAFQAECECLIYMTPALAKALLKNLQDQIDDYESDFSPIETDVEKRVTEKGKRRIVRMEAKKVAGQE